MLVKSQNWNTFKLELDRDLTDFETALNQYATDKKKHTFKTFKINELCKLAERL
jgi:hypothetical protein